MRGALTGTRYPVWPPSRADESVDATASAWVVGGGHVAAWEVSCLHHGADAADGRATTVVLSIHDRLSRADIDAICDRVRAVTDGRQVSRVVCDVQDVADPDLLTVGALARLGLLTRRLDRPLAIRGARPHLQELIRWLGLGAAIRGGGPGSRPLP